MHLSLCRELAPSKTDPSGHLSRVELMLGAEKGVSTRPAVEFSGQTSSRVQWVKGGSKIHCPLSSLGPYPTASISPSPFLPPTPTIIYVTEKNFKYIEKLKEYNE